MSGMDLEDRERFYREGKSQILFLGIWPNVWKLL